MERFGTAEQFGTQFSAIETDPSLIIVIYASATPIRWQPWRPRRSAKISAFVVIYALVRYSLFTMVDIHCHILPELDDGSESLEMSVGRGEMAIPAGAPPVSAQRNHHPST